MLEADVEQLNALAGLLDRAGQAVDGLDVRTAEGAIAEALPGSGLPEVCAQAGMFVEGAYLRVADRLRRIATITRHNAEAYMGTDEEFGQQLRDLDFHPSKGS